MKTRGPATEVPLPARHRPATLSIMRPGKLARVPRPRRTVLVLVLLAVVVAIVSPSAVATPSVVGSVSGVIRHGLCVGGPSHWRLRMTAETDGLLLVRFRIGGGTPGDTWNLFLDHNGTGFFAGSRVANEIGVVRVRRRTADLAGADVIRAAGHDVATGEVCRGRVDI
jgi:hypothetical protein